MKKILFALLLAAAFISCEKKEVEPAGPDPIEATILGRWQFLGFDDVIRYEFTSNKRFSIYVNDDGTFPTLEEFMQQNPNLTGHDWEYDGDTVVIDLNFGNYSRLVPNFKCDNYVIDWIDEGGAVHSTYYREGHDISECN